MTTWTKGIKAAILGFLLNEDGSFLLQETSGKIILNITFESDEKHAGNFTKEIKH